MVGIDSFSEADKDILCRSFPDGSTPEGRKRILDLLKERPEYILFPLTLQLAKSEKANSDLAIAAIAVACISLFIALIPTVDNILKISIHDESISLGGAILFSFMIVAIVAFYIRRSIGHQK
jgi:hypothetical protein